MEESHYYPFGLKHKMYNVQQFVFVTPPDGSPEYMSPVLMEGGSRPLINPYKYKYNGKELQDELGLNVYDYGARIYQPDAPHFWQIDPKAEKYYSLSPYVYVADNPVNAIDPDGKDIIFITRNSDGSAKEQFKYRKGNFYHENGKRYNPGKESVSKTMYATLAAYRKIESSGNKELKNMLHTLEKSNKKHYVESGEVNEVSSKTSKLSIENHQTTEKVKNGEGVNTRTTYNFTQESKDEFEKSAGVPNSNLSTVVHEMRHQYDYDQGKMADSVNKSGAEDPAEKRAVESENQAREIDGLPKRTTYGGVKIIPD